MQERTELLRNALYKCKTEETSQVIDEIIEKAELYPERNKVVIFVCMPLNEAKLIRDEEHNHQLFMKQLTSLSYNLGMKVDEHFRAFKTIGYEFMNGCVIVEMEVNLSVIIEVCERLHEVKK